MKTSYFTKIVGTTFEDRQKLIAQLHGNEKLRARREPDNEYDANAVAIDAFYKGEWLPIGYIAKDSNEALSAAMDSATTVEIKLRDITGGGDKNYGVNISVDYDTSEEPELKKLVPVIGSGYVYFDSTNHKYYDENMGLMISGSVYEQEHSPETNFSFAAKAMSKTSGLKPAVIESLWSENGEMASEYGTLAHKALEFYIDNLEVMMKLDKAKEVEHSASKYLPSHLGEMVDAYRNHVGVEYLGFVSTEVFVRHENKCGFIDSLWLSGKEAKIRDYKFIKKLRDVNFTGYGKYPKYTLQQNFYRSILEANGYKVPKMTLDIFNNGVWSSVDVKKVAMTKN